MTQAEADLRDLVWVRALCATHANRDLRERANLTLRDLGAAANVSPTTISRWEAGLAKPTGKRALAYARALRQIAATAPVAS